MSYNIFGMMVKVMENMDITNSDFNIPSDILDEIQKNIQNIIESFDIPDDNKTDVIKKINFMYTQTKFMSETDPLTRLYNRRYFENNFDREFARAKRYHCDLSIAILDIDFFKKINDTYGHSCGDYVLKEVAYLILNSLRGTDMVFRYGGEEFAILLTETCSENASIPLERVRRMIEDSKFYYKNHKINVTVSIGYSSCTDFETPWQMFDDADKALYKAKECGRNNVKSSVQ